MAFAPSCFGELSSDEKQFLVGYEKIRAALAADDLATARAAGAALGDAGAAIVRSEKIGTAREEFAKLSQRAIKLVAGRSDYYIVNCPMLKKEWVQPIGDISNPYAGSSMLNCGAIRRQTPAR